MSHEVKESSSMKLPVVNRADGRYMQASTKVEVQGNRIALPGLITAGNGFNVSAMAQNGGLKNASQQKLGEMVVKMIKAGAQTKKSGTAGLISISDDYSAHQQTDDHRDSSSIANNTFLQSIYDANEVTNGVVAAHEDPSFGLVNGGLEYSTLVTTYEDEIEDGKMVIKIPERQSSIPKIANEAAHAT